MLLKLLVALSVADAQLMFPTMFEENTVSSPQFTPMVNMVRDLSRMDESTMHTLPNDFCGPEVRHAPTKAGYIATGTGSRYFTWVQPAQDKDNKKLIFWFTGGPGCSSLLAAMLENGACGLKKGSTDMYTNKYSWTKAATIVYIDQAGASGFSESVESFHFESDVARTMKGYVKNFYKQLPEYSGYELYLTGESYGGHYVPAIAHMIHRGQKSGHFGKDVNLAGVEIGNGLTDPLEQFKAYAHMGLNGGSDVGGSLQKGVLSEKAHDQMVSDLPGCENLIDTCNKQGQGAASCATAFDMCMTTQVSPYGQTGMNVYDMRKECEVKPLCYDTSNYTEFLNTEHVQKLFGVNKTWEACNNNVNAGFLKDWMLDYQDLIVDMLNDGVPIRIMAGDVDFICNWLGNKAWTTKLEWKHGDEFRAAKDVDYLNGRGRIRTYKNFSFVQIYQAGHMVPMDQPEAALEFIKDYVNNNFEDTTNAEDLIV